MKLAKRKKNIRQSKQKQLLYVACVCKIRKNNKKKK